MRGARVAAQGADHFPYRTWIGIRIPEQRIECNSLALTNARNSRYARSSRTCQPWAPHIEHRLVATGPRRPTTPRRSSDNDEAWRSQGIRKPHGDGQERQGRLAWQWLDMFLLQSLRLRQERCADITRSSNHAYLPKRRFVKVPLVLLFHFPQGSLWRRLAGNILLPLRSLNGLLGS